MDTHPSLFFFVSLLFTIVIGTAAAVCARKRRAVPGAGPFFGAGICLALLALNEILSMLGPTEAAALFWHRVRFIFSALLPVFWIKFAVAFAGRKGLISRWLDASLFLIPVVTQAAIWTSGSHHLWVIREIAFVRHGSFWIGDLETRISGVWFFVYSIYGLLLLLTGLILFLDASLRMRPRRSGRIVLAAAGTLATVGNGVLSTFGLYYWVGFNPFAPAMGLGFLFFSIAVFGYRHADIPQSAALPAGDLKAGRAFATFLFNFFLLTIGVVTLVILSSRDYMETLRTQAESQLQNITEIKAESLANWHAERLVDAEILSQNPVFMDLAREFFAHPADPAVQDEMKSWLGRYHLYRHYEHIFVADSQGTVRLSAQASSGDSGRWLLRILLDEGLLRGGRVALLDVRGDGGGPIHFSVVIPVASDPAGGVPARILGAVVFRIDPEIFLYPLIRMWPEPSAGVENIFVRRDGNDALYLMDPESSSGSASEIRISLERTDDVSVQAVLGRQGILDGLNCRGEPVLAAAHSVSGTPWALVACEEKQAIYRPARDRWWLMIGLLVALLTAAGSGFGMVWRRERLRYFRSRAAVAQKLQDSLERFELANKATFDVVWDWDLRTNALWWSEHFQSLFGYSPEDVEPTIESWENRIHPDDRGRVVAGIRGVIDGGGQSWSDHYRFRCRDGRDLEILDRGYVTRDAAGDPVRMIGAMQDVTERIKAERAAIHSRDLMRYIIEHSRSAVAIHDRDLRYLYVSQKYLDDYRVKEKDVIGKHHYEIFPDLPGKWRDVHQKALRGEISFADADPYERADGTVEWTQWECRPWYEADGSIGGVVVYTEIITPRVKASEALRASLKEKEVLLKEIHHRVKNNMQIISSLLSLQASRFAEARFREAMNQTQRRIRSMALLHEKLYKSRNLSRIDFVEYAKSLSVHLLQSFALDPRRIKIRIDMDPAFFDIATANPLGLILNEMLSNTMKHAFPGDRTGEIVISLRRTGEDFLLAVRDNGIGLPPGFDLQSKGSFGIQIIHSLVEQLNAELTLGKADIGTAFELRFRELHYTPRLDPDPARTPPS